MLLSAVSTNGERQMRVPLAQNGKEFQRCAALTGRQAAAATAEHGPGPQSPAPPREGSWAGVAVEVPRLRHEEEEKEENGVHGS